MQGSGSTAQWRRPWRQRSTRPAARPSPTRTTWPRPTAPRALIDAAVEKFGRLDVLINNAGIIKWAGLPDADLDNLERHLAVHVLGSFNTTRAAWPHMVEQGYGRIVMTTSSGIFGLPQNLSYATAKAAVIGLTRSLATTSTAHGIKVNLIAPAAYTRMAGQASDTDETERPGGADVAGPGRPHGGVPRPRGLPRQRGDVRGRRRTVLPHLHRLDARATSRPTRPSRTWPSTGTPSTTRRGTPSRPTSPTGPPPSWPTCSPTCELTDGLLAQRIRTGPRRPLP